MNETMPKYNSEKPELTKNQAAALDHAMSVLIPPEIARIHILNKSDDISWSEERKALDELSIDTLLKALYIGYKIKLEPEDELRNYYQFLKSDSQNDEIKQIRIEEIESVLGTLKIKIKGINA